MRGQTKNQDQLFYSFSIEDRIPKSHPLRVLKKYVDDILLKMDDEFSKLYSGTGRPSTPPEFILRALFLQTLFTIRSEGQLIQQLEYNFLYRWFVGLGVEDKVWDETVFSKNRQRLIDGAIADKFFAEVLLIAAKNKLISNEHFSVDGTLIEAWASLKSFQKKEDSESLKKSDKNNKDPDDRNPSVNFKGEKSAFAFISLENGGSLKLSGINFLGTSEAAVAECAIRTSRSPMVEHYQLFVDNCAFVDFNDGGKSVFKAHFGTYADTIQFSNCLFKLSLGSGPIRSLKPLAFAILSIWFLNSFLNSFLKVFAK